MVVRLEGKIDNQTVIFWHKQGDEWEAIIPSNMSGIYIVELTAYDEAGNKGYASKYLVTVNIGHLNIKIEPFQWESFLCQAVYNARAAIGQYVAELPCPGYNTEAFLSDYRGEIIGWGGVQ